MPLLLQDTLLVNFSNYSGFNQEADMPSPRIISILHCAGTDRRDVMLLNSLVATHGKKQ